MTYQVLARAYRPTTFDEVIGQEAISKTLVGAINEERVAHAYLFCGSRGVGKTSMARILARALNCEQGPTPKPCLECDACQSIAGGRDVDFIEIDGASNRGIDEIRNIRDAVRYKPAHARFKIYLIDEVHMLTGPAFNALLKTLEEPPAHVKFFFATTEPYDVPETIRSRCQRFDFRRISPVTIARHLASVAASVGIESEPEALAELARSARGSMRDGLVRLDQVRAFTGGVVTAPDVHQVLGTISLTALTEWARVLAAGDVPQLFARIGALYEAGADLEAFLGQWAEFLRDLLVVKTCGLKEELLTIALGDPSLEQLAESFSYGGLTGMVGLFVETATRLRKSSLPRVLLEVAFVRAALWEEWIPRGDVTAALEGKPPVDVAGTALEPRAISAPVTPDPAGKAPVMSSPAVRQAVPQPPAASTTPTAQRAATAPILRKGRPTVEQGGIQVLFESGQNSFALSKLTEESGQLEKIGEAIAEVMGARWQVKLVQAKSSVSRSASEVTRDEFVQAALQIFEGRVLDVRQSGEA